MRLRRLLPLLLSHLAACEIVTITQSAAPVPTSNQYLNDTTFQEANIAAHNFYRAQHNASDLVWNETIATYAAEWAGKCNFEHSGNPGTGENLAAGYPNVTASIDGWGLERLAYDFAAATFGHDTGHFTQVVWKATTSVGCGRANCNGQNGTPGWYLVCEYWPQGNVIGQFAENVQAAVAGDPKVGAEGGGNEVVEGGGGVMRRGGWMGVVVLVVGLWVGW